MREIRTSGTVRGEGGNILTYSAATLTTYSDFSDVERAAPDVATLHPGYGGYGFTAPAASP